MLGPQQQIVMQISLDGCLANEEIVEVSSPISERRIFVYGTIHYTDGYQREHQTDFCYYIMWTVAGQLAWVLYHRHNQAT